MRLGGSAMKRALLRGVVLVVLAALFGLTMPAWSQEVTASIVGTVTDPSGAPINGATITATDKDRGVDYTTKTNDAGSYNLTRVPVGSYEVRVGAQGFQTSVHPPFTLVLNQTARLDVQLKVGQVTETVEVTGAAPILQTETTQVSTVIDSTSTDKLPLATRNYVQLTLLSAGSVHPDPKSMTQGNGPSGGGRPYINGNREQSNNFLLDGMDNNQVSDNLVGYTPSVDAIQEFNMITQNASAEFGNFQGGIVSASIKSGTNSLHGDVFEFFRNDKLNANSWSNNAFGNGKPAVRWNQFGGTLGGPILKNKLFFFADYQGQRFDFPASPSPFNVFTAAERGGDFSALCQGGFTAGICNDRGKDSKGNVIIINQLYSPFNVVAGQRQPYLNNKITDPIDNVAANLFASNLYPQASGTATDLTGNAVLLTKSARNSDQGDLRMDYNLSDKDRISGRYSQGHQSNPTNNSIAVLENGFDLATMQNFVVTWTHTISSSILNEARAGVNYVKLNTGEDPGKIGNLGTTLGIPNSNGLAPGLLALNFSGGKANSVGNSGVTQLFADTVFQYEDGLVITRGRHVFHTGFQFWRQRINSYYSGNNGQLGFMNFTGRFTGATTGGALGFGEADFYLGLPDSEGRGVITGTWGQRANVLAPYFQDDWRVTNHLTLNLGLRY